MIALGLCCFFELGCYRVTGFGHTMSLRAFSG